MALTRRTLLRRSALGAGGAALALAPAARGQARMSTGLGVPEEDPMGLIDLPPRFRYRVLQTIDDQLSNGAPVPGDFDGMAAFPGRQRGTTVLVRNHELSGNDAQRKAVVQGRNRFDPAAIGGTTALVVGANNRLLSSYVTSSGTIQNCAGGATTWGTWITCEETRNQGHGYCFEVDPYDPENALSKTPITAMGYFSHVAIDVDPRTGIVYLTEDDPP